MDNEHAAPPPTNNPARAQLAQVFGHLTGGMVAALPRPVPNTREAFAARNLCAVSQVAALVPANPIETMFGMQLVVAAAQGLACQRVAQDADPTTANRHIHQAAKMMRVSHAAANVVLRLQAARQKREATPEAASSAALTEHCALQLMLQALTRLDAENAAVDRAAAERAAGQAAAVAAASALPPPPAPEPEPITEADIAAAEAYAQTNASNLNRARILRRKGGMPNWGMFTPPEPNVVRAIAFGQSAFLDGLLPQGA